MQHQLLPLPLLLLLIVTSLASGTLSACKNQLNGLWTANKLCDGVTYFYSSDCLPLDDVGVVPAISDMLLNLRNRGCIINTEQVPAHMINMKLYHMNIGWSCLMVYDNNYPSEKRCFIQYDTLKDLYVDGIIVDGFNVTTNGCPTHLALIKIQCNGII